MKSIEVLFREDIGQMVRNFVLTFMDDLNKAVKNINLTPAMLLALIYKCIDQMTLVKIVCKKKKADINIIRMELEILESGAAQFTFVPLDENRFPVLIREECPMLIVRPSSEDIEEKMKGREIQLLELSEDSKDETPPEENPPQN